LHRLTSAYIKMFGCPLGPLSDVGRPTPLLAGTFWEKCGQGPSPTARGKGPYRTLGSQRPSLPALFWKSAGKGPPPGPGGRALTGRWAPNAPPCRHFFENCWQARGCLPPPPCRTLGAKPLVRGFPGDLGKGPCRHF
jgi:hypothetical protein